MWTSGHRSGWVVGMAGLLCVVFLAASSPGGASAKGKPKAADAGATFPKAFNKRVVEEHIRNHQRYPASKATMLAECDNLSDFTDADRAWFRAKLPEGTYKDPAAVVAALGLDKAPAAKRSR